MLLSPRKNSLTSLFREVRVFKAQPCLSRVKARLCPARGHKFGCVCSYVAGHYPGILMTSHIGTNTPKFVPPRWGRPRFDPTQTGLCKFGWVWSSLKLGKQLIFDCFLTFGVPGPRGPRNPFRDFLGLWAERPK